jgi:hypothetical protein
MPDRDWLREAVFISDHVFGTWINRFENQHYFFSLQEAFKRWLSDDGFKDVGDNYGLAVQVILVYLCRYIANPHFRHIIVSETDPPLETAILQVKAPEEDEEQTFWEFFTEEKFHEAYRQWRESRGTT